MGDVFVVTTMWWWPCGGTVDDLVVKVVFATFIFSLFNIIISITIYQCGGMVDVYVAVLYEGGVGGGEQ